MTLGPNSHSENRDDREIITHMGKDTHTVLFMAALFIQTKGQKWLNR